MDGVQSAPDFSNSMRNPWAAWHRGVSHSVLWQPNPNAHAGGCAVF